MHAKQVAILSAASKLVKPGGRLVYATCSVLAEENQDSVAEFLAARSDFRMLPAGEVMAEQTMAPRLASGMGDYFVLSPQHQGTDGFFAAVLERSAA
jgi:16S rRNA (cytosine967-C5)-methyltransferase